MASHRLTAGLLALAAATGCRLDRIPPGAAVDADAIRGVIATFHESIASGDFGEFEGLFEPEASVVWDDGEVLSVARFWEEFMAWRAQASSARIDARPLRLQVRHAGDAGTAWLTSVWVVTRLDGDTKTLEHRAVFLLRRRGDRWDVVSLLLQRQSPQSS